MPVAIRMVMSSAGMWRSSPSRMGRSVLLGMGRVMSQTEIATVWPGLTRRRSGIVPMGLRRAVRIAPSGSGSPGTKVGSMTVVRSSGSSTSSPSRPYASLTFIILLPCNLVWRRITVRRHPAGVTSSNPGTAKCLRRTHVCV